MAAMQQPQMQDVPVYLFTGFLEAGKTTFIQETLTDKRFNNGEPTLLLLCEEGEEEYDLSAMPSKEVYIRSLEDKSELNTENLAKLLKETGATRVVLEYNGMWMLKDLYDAMPEEWAVYQEMFFADANTIMMFNANNNMRGLIVDKMSSCELVVFNRFKKSMDKMEYHKLVRNCGNMRTDIAYEFEDNHVEYDEIKDPLPFDVDAPVIEIKDNHYALWYRDIMEEPKKYDGKMITFRGIVAMDPSFPKHCFAVGRHVMTCCPEDITYHCVVAEWDKAATLQQRAWVNVTGKIVISRHKLYRGKGPVLKVTNVVLTQAPENEIATYY